MNEFQDIDSINGSRSCGCFLNEDKATVKYDICRAED